MPNKIIIKNNETGHKDSFQIKGQPSYPCDFDSAWIDTADYNDDGHDDVRFHDDPANDMEYPDDNKYTYFYYDPDSRSFVTR